MAIKEWIEDESKKEGLKEKEIKTIIQVVETKIGGSNQVLFSEKDIRVLVHKVSTSKSGLIKKGFNIEEVTDYCIELMYENRLNFISDSEIVGKMKKDYKDGRLN